MLVLTFQMNRAYFAEKTSSIVLHLKEYNYKLCRKGLYRRLLDINITFGDFKTIEKEFLGNSMNSQMEKQVEKLYEQKLSTMEKELKRTETSLDAIQKTINNIKLDIKSKTNDRGFTMWLKRIEGISKRFKIMYSDECNSLYNHAYKLFKTNKNAWDYILNDIQWLQNNVFIMHDPIETLVEGFNEGDLTNMFSLKTENANEKGNLKRSKDEKEGPSSMCQGFKKLKKNEGKEKGNSSNNNEKENNTTRRMKENGKKGGHGGPSIKKVLATITNNVDEVGTVDMDGFEEFVGRFMASQS